MCKCNQLLRNAICVTVRHNPCLTAVPANGQHAHYQRYSIVTSKLRFIPRLAALALASAACFPSGVFAQAQGSVDVDITLNNGITILYYYSSVDVNISLTDLFGTPVGCVAGTGDTRACAVAPLAAAVNAAPVGGQLVANFNINPAALSINPSAVPLVLQNLWAVRAVGGTANTTTVAIAAGLTTLNGPSGSTIGMSNFRVQTPAFGAAAAVGPAVSVQFPDPGLVTARPGDVRIDLNLTGANALGDYSTTGAIGSNADSNFTLTVTST